jgi:hypothetical protein
MGKKLKAGETAQNQVPVEERKSIEEMIQDTTASVASVMRMSGEMHKALEPVRQAEALKSILKMLASLKVPDRPGRYEPRMLKRRRDKYPIVKEPRQVIKNAVNLDVASVQ